MKRIFTIAAAAVGLMIGAQTASATTIAIRTFSGSGTAFGALGPVDSDEPWLINCPSDCPHQATGGLDFGWGSPGVDQSVTPYDETTAATDFEISFPGFALDPAQIPIGSSDACAGRGTGGTTFCAIPGALGVLWTPSFDPSHPDTIAFFAPPGTSLAPGENYFVNIFLLGALPKADPLTGIVPFSFSGEWTTEVTPEPGSLLLLGTGLAFCARRLRRKFRSNV
jgi:hypothetical protein